MPISEQNLLRILEAARAVTSTLRLSELLQTVMGLAGKVVQAEASSILLLDPDTDELYFDIAIGEMGDALQQIRLKKGEGIAGWVAMHGKHAVVNDVSQDSRWTQRADRTTKFQTRSLLAVPMLVRDKLIGVMEAINRVDGMPFSEEDTQMLELFAGQAAVALENARLFESIRQEKEKMSTILGEMREGAVLLDAAGRVMWGNPAARTLLGQTLSEGASWPALESVFLIRPDWQELRTTLGGAGGIELVRREAPRLILAGVVTQICDDHGKISGYLVVVSNVTEERQEAQLKRNFLSLVSHKLKTPLVSIRGFTPLLLEKPEELNAFQKTAMEAIDRNSQLLTSLVEKLVWFAALEAETLELSKKSHNLSSVLELALSELGPFLRSMPGEIVQEPSLMTLPPVFIDKIWMKEVFRNLIENALKFNPKTPRQVHISGRVVEKTVELLFKDNGPGIPSEEREKIFQKFYQIEGSFTGQVQGMGLGLALVQRVVSEHAGRVHVTSTLGEGTAITVVLPIAAPTL